MSDLMSHLSLFMQCFFKMCLGSLVSFLLLLTPASADYFEFTLDASKQYAGARGWDHGVAVHSWDATDHWAIVVNGRRLKVLGHSLAQPFLVGRVAVRASDVFDESGNLISAIFNGGNLSGVAFKIYYFNSRGEPRHICEGRLQHETGNLVDCGNIQMNLQEIDPDLVRRIEETKAEIREHRARANRPNADETIARQQEQLFEQEKSKIEAQIEALNEELKAINFEEFDSIDVDQMAKLIGEDPSIATSYHRLKQNVDHLKDEIQQEVQRNQQRTQQAEADLARAFGEATPMPPEFTPPWSSAQAHSRASEGEVPEFTSAPFASTFATSADGHLHEVSQEVIESLDAALRRGDQGEFLAIVSQWTSFQAQAKAGLERNGKASGAAFEKLRQSQARVLRHIKTHVDSYGFFTKARIPDAIKRVIGEQIKNWNESYSRDLKDELNTWQEDLNPTQVKVIEQIAALGTALDRYPPSALNSPQADSVKEEARNVLNTALEGSADQLLLAARVAPEMPSAPAADEGVGVKSTDGSPVLNEAEEHLQESQTGLKVAAAFGDFLIGASPLGSIKDLYEAFSGKSLLTQEPLSLSERVLSGAFAVIGICSLGSSNVLKASVKGVFNVGKRLQAAKRLKTAKAAVTAGRAHRIEEVARGVEGVVESAASLAHTNPDLGRKLDYVLGKATGAAHNVDRSRDMLRQMERIGFSESQGTRTYLADHLKKALNDPTSIVRTQENGRVLRETLLTGPRGSLKVESVWEDSKLITVGVFGKGTGFRHGQ